MMEEVSVTSQVFAFTLLVISISRPLTVVTRPLTELSGPLTVVRRPLTAQKMLGRIREGRYPVNSSHYLTETLHGASSKAFTASH